MSVLYPLSTKRFAHPSRASRSFYLLQLQQNIISNAMIIIQTMLSSSKRLHKQFIMPSIYNFNGSLDTLSCFPLILYEATPADVTM